MKFHDYQRWINSTFFLFRFSDRILALPWSREQGIVQRVLAESFLNSSKLHVMYIFGRWFTGYRHAVTFLSQLQTD